MSKQKQELGRWGENKAAEFLAEKGLFLLERNFRTEYGELDIIAQKENQIIFVEVKTRSNDAFGLPEEAVNTNKMTHMLKSAQSYLLARPEMEIMDWRIDVIAIRKIDNSEEFEIVWFENAII